MRTKRRSNSHFIDADEATKRVPLCRWRRSPGGPLGEAIQVDSYLRRNVLNLTNQPYHVLCRRQAPRWTWSNSWIRFFVQSHHFVGDKRHAEFEIAARANYLLEGTRSGLIYWTLLGTRTGWKDLTGVKTKYTWTKRWIRLYTILSDGMEFDDTYAANWYSHQTNCYLKWLTLLFHEMLPIIFCRYQVYLLKFQQFGAQTFSRPKGDSVPPAGLDPI